MSAGEMALVLALVLDLVSALVSALALAWVTAAAEMAWVRAGALVGKDHCQRTRLPVDRCFCLLKHPCHS